MVRRRRGRTNAPVVREALQRLQTDGVVIARQGSGTYVRRFDVEGDFPYFCEVHCEDGMKGIVHVGK